MLSLRGNGRIVPKPWGQELIFAENDRYLGKKLYIKEGHSLSRQYHNIKDETFLVQSGIMDLEIGDPEFLTIKRMDKGSVYRCRPLTIHRMVAVSDTIVIEVSSPEINDVIRLEDNYGRL